MAVVLNKIIEDLENVLRAAEMGCASFGFPNDRIEIKSVHFGDDRSGRVGDLFHPTDYIVNITDLYRHTWIIAPLKDAIGLLRANAGVLDEIEKIQTALKSIDVEKLQYLASGGLGSIDS